MTLVVAAVTAGIGWIVSDNSSDFSFELWTPDRRSRPTILRKARFSPKLWTSPIRYGFRKSNVSSCL
jgi:hypothetical protein